ncbi:MAG: hypothetical protein E7306_11545 [Butyrivibrio sp.]|jgi:hypothetical protein|nr:hypothetical protein [Butyrivibrio sp.]
MSISIQSKNNIYSNIFSKAYPQNSHAQKDFTEDEYSLRKQEYAQRLQERNKGSVVDQAMSYADQLKASRTKAKETSLEKKKLQYNFKKISSQIVRSKNSVSARKAVQAAKREIMRLKRLKANGEYDEEEVQLAIDHAKAMEKVAKKKMAHLEQEEMVERAHKGAGAALEEIQENKEESNEETNEEEKISEEDLQASEMDIDEEYDETDYQAVYDSIRQELEEAQYEAQMQMEEMTAEISENAQEIAESSSDAMSQMMDELSEEMSEMLEEMDLTELAETMYAPDSNMSEDDLKMLKIKHRGKEMKEIAEADKEYLKGMMEHEKSKQTAGDGISGAGPSAPSNAFGTGDAPKITPVISMPGSAAGATMIAPTISGGYDVSV